MFFIGNTCFRLWRKFKALHSILGTHLRIQPEPANPSAACLTIGRTGKIRVQKLVQDGEIKIVED